jgi:putative pyruvate formate lyase activating enzyme
MKLHERFESADLGEVARLLRNCDLCPRECHADRYSRRLGYCSSDASFNIASVCIHRGEEPSISGSRGICNVFFGHCNMQCIYCQNHQISLNSMDLTLGIRTLDEALSAILPILGKGIPNIGFVSPSHCVPQMVILIRALWERGYHPTTVYNSNGYDKVETLRSLEGLIDVYLPDFKYMDDKLAVDYSDSPGYSVYARRAIREMYRQKGSTVRVSEEGYAETGLIIRHLVLPGQVENSKRVLACIAEELSPDVHLSLMSQYYPTGRVAGHPLLGRTVTAKEYRQVTEEMERLGFTRGWIQEAASHEHYRPDFNREHPFEG